MKHSAGDPSYGTPDSLITVVIRVFIVDYKIVAKKPASKSKRVYYALVWEDENLFLDFQSMTYSVRRFTIDKNFVPRFKYNTDRTTLMTAEYYWDCYEYQRLFGNKKLPKLQITQVEFQQHTVCVDIVPKDKFDFYVALHIENGITISEAYKKLPPDFHPRWVISRVGKSSGKCLALSDNIQERGIYTFVTNEDDFLLSKITLGNNVRKVYDLKPIYEKYHIDLPEGWE